MSPARATAVVLRDAADVIDARGLHQGAVMPDGGDPASCGVCAVGAIRVAVVGSPAPGGSWWPRQDRLISDAVDAVNAVVAPLVAVGENVTDWNDEPGRTADEVSGLLRHAAGLFDAAGGAL